MKNIGFEIKAIMDKKGLKRRELAHFLDMTEANISKIYSKESLDTAQLLKICQFIGTPISYFFDDETLLGPLLKIEGEKNKTIQGDGNVLGNKARENLLNTSLMLTADGRAVLEERIKNLEGIIKEKDKQLEEKERLITVLMKK